MTHIELATDEDRFYQIDRWAKLFKATTWEEIKMITEGNEYMTQATQELYECNADELIRQQCRAREEYYKYQRALEKTTEERDRLASEKEQLAFENDQLVSENNQLVSENKKAQETLKAQAEEIQRLKALLGQ